MLLAVGCRSLSCCCRVWFAAEVIRVQQLTSSIQVQAQPLIVAAGATTAAAAAAAAAPARLPLLSMLTFVLLPAPAPALAVVPTVTAAATGVLMAALRPAPFLAVLPALVLTVFAAVLDTPAAALRVSGCLTWFGWGAAPQRLLTQRQGPLLFTWARRLLLMIMVVQWRWLRHFLLLLLLLLLLLRICLLVLLLLLLLQGFALLLLLQVSLKSYPCWWCCWPRSCQQPADAPTGQDNSHRICLLCSISISIL